MRYLIVLALVVVATTAAADLPRGRWATARPSTLPPNFPGGMVYVPLDDQALTAESLSEYRIVQGGAEVPYRMVLENGEVLSEVVPSKVVLWNESQAPASVNITLDLGPDAPRASLLQLDLAGDNFSADITVAKARGEREAGRVVKKDKVYRRGAGFAKTSVTFGPTNTRYLRLELYYDQGKPPKVNNVQVFSTLAIPRHLVEVPAKLTRTEDRKAKRTVLELDPGELVRDIAETSFLIADPLFDRSVAIEAAFSAPRSGEAIAYTWVARAQLTRTKPSERAALRQDLSAARFIRMSIENGDDRPLAITRVHLWREQRGIIFNADPGEKYELWYGRKDAPEPVYDLAKLPLTVPPDQLPQATLARARALPLAPPPPPPWSETHRALFWVILIGVISLLLLVILKAMRRANVQTQ